MSEKSGDDEEMYDKDEDITERKSSDGSDDSEMEDEDLAQTEKIKELQQILDRNPYDYQVF